MPGIAGVALRAPGASLSADLDSLLAPALDDGEYAIDRQVSSVHQWGLGRVRLRSSRASGAASHGAAVHVVVHGDLHNREDLAAAAGSSSVAPVEDIVRALYEREDLAFAARLKGSFAIALIDERRRRLVLVADALGSIPTLWIQTGEGVWFGPRAAGLLKSSGIPRRLERRAVADYLTFGTVFGTKTLAAGVSLVAPGTVLCFDWETGARTEQPYRRMSDAFQAWDGTRDAYLDEIRDRFNHAVATAWDDRRTMGLSLSGGLDSRAILSGLGKRRTEVRTYTLGLTGCADDVIGQRLATLAGTRHRFFALDGVHLEGFVESLSRMVQLTDGLYLTHGLTEILALEAVSAFGVDVLLRGHCGELAKTSLAWPFHTDERIHTMTSQDEFVPYFLGRVNYISRDLPASSLFDTSWRDDLANGARQSLEESIAGSSLRPADLCSYIYLVEHHRRFTVPSLELFRTRVEVRLPFADDDFLAVLFRGPARWREGTDIHRHITRSNDARLLHVRNSNTGAPGDASPFVERIMDPVNSVLKRLNVRGFGHYHRFDRWMKQQFVTSVEHVLLDSTTRARGLLNEHAVRRVLDEQRAGRVDRSYLLQILMILELWQRQNID